MVKVVILGTGNLATNLFKACKTAKNITVVQVYNHHNQSLKAFEEFTEVTTNLNDLKTANFYILALKDDIIPGIAKKINTKSGIVLHTSGAMHINALDKNENFGVFYPLQTFSKEKAVNFTEIPICIEANSEENLDQIKDFALKLSQDVREIDSTQRKALHLAAVFVNNFSNHLYDLGDEICREHQVDFSILQALIKETASKVETLSPREAQTGPSVRADTATMHSHLELLTGHKKKIYTLLSDSIQKLHGKKL
ncbi:Predicted oxidoreductase, contains short-chain dehydrogenase (SDR) and DUF2520 domains [Salegentibacter echinorum]|uniref:Predicted oxidoreductase, contains short-chain dehydrogenase (SDR) and DUF2520 domains n=1 Tax=Salegentibacter echinorum TaxID=1073325 RepID=A0A1M5CW65_SALEC|nr:Rossmann-like and DUF2520 domain-containing protein [Salegentibacter echinorum]SHF58906.1 Predicted oxidoreductase, contains short-chain dehydrogenase (SDR) and DUF2520 domains [Salegentibacter echinorum]